MGLGFVLLAFGLFMVFSPVTTDRPEPSCGDRLAIALALGSPPATSLDAEESDWCRDEAVDQVMGGIVAAALPGAGILAWQGRQARRARRDLRPDATGIGHTPDGLEPAHPFRRLPGRLVSTRNQTWLVVEDQPDRSSLLLTSTHARKLPLAARAFDVAGDTSRLVTFRVPGTAEELTAQPVEVVPSDAVATLPRPDPLQPALAHPPTRGRLRRSLEAAGLMLAVAVLAAATIVWAAVSDQDWFWEVSDKGESEGLSMAHLFGILAIYLAVAGLAGLVRFVKRWAVLRQRPWELADIMTPDSRHVVLRQHAGAFGPVTCRVAASDDNAAARVLACKQLWFARAHGGQLFAATPDFRTMVWLRPTGPQDVASPSAGSGA